MILGLQYNGDRGILFLTVYWDTLGYIIVSIIPYQLCIFKLLFYKINNFQKKRVNIAIKSLILNKIK